MRYYYSCPIKAAYMAKHFGMLFLFRYEDGQEISLRGLGNMLAYADGSLGEAKFYVHPDSLHLLDAQKEDLIGFTPQCYSDERRYEIVTQIGWADWKGDVKRKIHAKARNPEEWERCVLTHEWDDWNIKNIIIIQRNGIAFHWPETEAE